MQVRVDCRIDRWTAEGSASVETTAKPPSSTAAMIEYSIARLEGSASAAMLVSRQCVLTFGTFPFLFPSTIPPIYMRQSMQTNTLKTTHMTRRHKSPALTHVSTIELNPNHLQSNRSSSRHLQAVNKPSTLNRKTKYWW